VNPRRKILGLPALSELKSHTSISDGLSTIVAEQSPSKVAKAPAIADLELLKASLEKLSSTEFEVQSFAAAELAQNLSEDPASLEGVSREELLASALRLYDDNVCPVSDTVYDPAEFREHVAEKLAHLSQISEKRVALEGKVAPILALLHATGSALAGAIRLGVISYPPFDVSALVDFNLSILGRYRQLKKLLPMEETRAVLWLHIKPRTSRRQLRHLTRVSWPSPNPPPKIQPETS
jgi:hypothetical protein